MEQFKRCANHWAPANRSVCVRLQYLMNPDGEFVTFYGKSFTAEQIADSLCEHISNWKS